MEESGPKWFIKGEGVVVGGGEGGWGWCGEPVLGDEGEDCVFGGDSLLSGRGEVVLGVVELFESVVVVEGLGVVEEPEEGDSFAGEVVEEGDGVSGELVERDECDDVGVVGCVEEVEELCGGDGLDGVCN